MGFPREARALYSNGGKVTEEVGRAEIQRFLLEHIASYEELEIVLLLCQRAERDWTAAQIAEETRMPAGACSAALEALQKQGLLAEGALAASFRYAPGSSALAAHVVRLAAFYQQQRLAVVQMMSANAVDRLRTAAIRRFAEAFRFRERG